jgi:C1A family cysteine protease
MNHQCQPVPINLDLYRPKTARGGHAVALVGYTPDRFIVRNSWGTTWGDKGFGYASSAYAQAAFTESYGVALAN